MSNAFGPKNSCGQLHLGDRREVLWHVEQKPCGLELLAPKRRSCGWNWAVTIALQTPHRLQSICHTAGKRL